ncbi:hypothetical protein RM863_12755 [Streptomyces sp. DSM 41014]|uniref:DUF1778 domain-containing protein n=1 Tax=Streptomyces hintoniae TaxID=3075521 RepID=A0ABU2UIF9_9ACTN|nr:hypothetical protein [Streptomyces sp. DSM 41014]MDT0472994.1 hypothetical protein [Streptomyces sp. DSM 41014]
MSETPDKHKLNARMLRLAAAAHRKRAAELDMAAAAAEAAGSFENFARFLTEAEAREVAQHPDLAELNIRLDSLYGD